MRNLSKIFSQAWGFARNGVKAFGGNVRDYLPESLRLAHAANRRNVTASDMVKIMLGKKLTLTQIRAVVNSKFEYQTAKNIARRIWNMFRSKHCVIKKYKCEITKNNLYHLISVNKEFTRTSAISRALKMETKRKAAWVKPPLPMSKEEINACRMANAFHRALSTGVYVPPNLV